MPRTERVFLMPFFFVDVPVEPLSLGCLVCLSVGRSVCLGLLTSLYDVSVFFFSCTYKYVCLCVFTIEYVAVAAFAL